MCVCVVLRCDWGQRKDLIPRGGERKHIIWDSPLVTLELRPGKLPPSKFLQENVCYAFLFPQHTCGHTDAQ